MTSQDKHGHRHALFASTSAKGSHRAPSSPTPNLRGRARKLGIAAVVTGMFALTALSNAHAQPGLISAAQDLAAGTVFSPTAHPAVAADAASALAFDRPQVGAVSAPEAAPAPAPAPAPAAAPVPAAPAAPAPPSPTLRAPLASMSVTSPFGFRVNPLTGSLDEMHTGMDLSGQCSTPVLAAAAGTVTEAGWSPYGGGNRIVVDHGNGLKTTYNHLDRIGVSVGQALTQGGQIAGVGTTGNSTGCHLHFEVMLNDQTVDPVAYM